MDIQNGPTFEISYQRKNLDAIRHSGRRYSFRADAKLARAIEHASLEKGYRYTSEFIRAAIINAIERIIRGA